LVIKQGDAKPELNTICLNYLKQAIDILKPQIIISVGGYANDRIKDLKKKNLIPDTIDCKLIPHPSPRALNNQDWVEKAKKWYIDNDIIKYFK
jgi:single-strand selective monofunctional uracil DNA glycosylase